MPSTPDLSFTSLDKFVNKPVVENCKAKSGEEEPKVVRKNDDAPIIEEYVLDNEEEDVSQPKIKKKTVRPSIAKIDRFTWVFFLAIKDETSGILKSFTRIENLVDHKVKVIRCDNRTEFKNREMNQFCKIKVMMERRLMKIQEKNECNDQEKEDNVNSTNNVNTVSSTVNTADTNEVNVVGENISIELPFDPNMPTLEDVSTFDFSRDDEDDGAVADMNNLDTTI
nr:putative ribonuclease H-like domain-containing protein [Tanacetum cinerariifolium]